MRRQCLFLALTFLGSAALAAPARMVEDLEQAPLLGGTVLWSASGTSGKTFFIAIQAVPGPLSRTPTSHSAFQLWLTDGTGRGTVLLADHLLRATDLAVADGRAFFQADDGIHGGEPWTSDGTPQGTSMIADLVPGAEGSFPWYPVAFRGAFYFTARGSNTTERRLWRTDGTPAGTSLVQATPWPIVGGWVTPALGALFGWFDDGAHGAEPWRTDGTAEGSWMLADVRPGPDWSLVVTEFAELDGAVLFGARGPDRRELWRSDGTPAATSKVADAFVSRNLRRAGRLVFFEGWDSEHGYEPWRSDGTMDGTIRLGDLYAGARDSQPSGFTALDDAVYFNAFEPTHGAELWRTDGSEAGTTLVKDIQPGPVGSNPDALLVHEGRLLFRADDGTHGREPWRSDGSAGGTELLADIRLGSQPSLGQPGTIGAFRVVGNRLFFAADDGVRGFEPWTSDGTPARTEILADLNPFVGTLPSTPRVLTPAGRAVFVADLSGRLWHSDGTAAGTRLVGGSEVSVGCCLVAVGERALFLNGATSDAWISDGTDEGTFPISTLVPTLEDLYSEPFVSLGQRALLPTSDANGESGLWASDGTAAGTAFLRSGDIGAGWGVLDGAAYLSFSDGLTRYELWKTDGTPEGTSLVRDIRPGPGGSAPREFVAMGDRMFFTADDEVHGRELWTSDGTSDGTLLVRDLPPVVAASSPRYMATTGDAVYFRRSAAAGAFELWKSDGTEAGTVLLRTFEANGVDQLTGVANRLFFLVRLGSSTDGEVALWTSDGTEAGTSELATFPAVAGPDHLAAVEGRLLFSAGSGGRSHPGARQLFRSDGTVNGTRPILDVAPERFVRVGTRIFFAGDDGVHGQELWTGRAGVLAGRPHVALRDLRAETRALRLRREVASALEAPIDAATRALERHDRRAARRALAVFVVQLQALAGRRIPADAAYDLVTFAEDIRELLDGSAGQERESR